MPVNVKPLFDKIMKDPDVIPDKGQEKKDLALDMVLQRATQAVNNEKALSMASSDTSVSKLTDFVTFFKATDYDLVEQVILLMLKKGSPDLMAHLRGIGRQRVVEGKESKEFSSSGKGAKGSGLRDLYRDSMKVYHPDKLGGYGIPATHEDKNGNQVITNPTEAEHLDEGMQRMAGELKKAFTGIGRTLNNLNDSVIKTMQDDETLEERLERLEGDAMVKAGLPRRAVEEAQNFRRQTSIKVNVEEKATGIKGRLGRTKLVERVLSATDLREMGYNNVWEFKVGRGIHPDVFSKEVLPTSFHELENDLKTRFHENGTMKIQEHLINFQNRASRLKEIRDSLKETNPDVKFDPNHLELREENDQFGKPIKLDTTQINRYLEEVDPNVTRDADNKLIGPVWGGPKLKEQPQQKVRETPKVERDEDAPKRTVAEVLSEHDDPGGKKRAAARHDIDRAVYEGKLNREAAKAAQEADDDKKAADELTRQANAAQKVSDEAKVQADKEAVDKARVAEETTKQEAEDTRLAAEQAQADTAEKARLDQERDKAAQMATEAKKVSDEAAKSEAAGGGAGKPPDDKVPQVATRDDDDEPEKPSEEQIDEIGEDIVDPTVVEEVDPADIDQPSVAEVEEVAEQVPAGREAEFFRQTGKQERARSRLDEEPMVEVGARVRNPENGKWGVLQHAYKDGGIDEHGYLFRHEDGSGGFTASIGIRDKQEFTTQNVASISASDWEKDVKEHNNLASEADAEPYDGKVVEAAAQEEPPVAEEPTPAAKPAAKEPTRRRRTATKKPAETPAAVAEEPAAKEPTPEPEVPTPTEAPAEEPAVEEPVAEASAEAKKFGGSKPAAAHLKEQLGEEEFNKHVEAGALDDVKNIRQAKQYLIDAVAKEPTAEETPVDETDEGAAKVQGDPVVEGTEREPQGKLLDVPTADTGKKGKKGKKGAGKKPTKEPTPEPESVDEAPPGEAPPIADEVPPPDAKKKRMMDKARKEGLFEHIAADKPFTYENAAEAEEAMAKLSTDKLGPLLDKTTKAKKAAKDKADAVQDNQDKVKDAKKDADLKASANDGDVISRLSTEFPDGMDDQTAVDQYRQIAEHVRNHEGNLSDGTKKSLKKASDKLIKQNPNADFQGVHNRIEQHDDDWDTKEGQESYQKVVEEHKQELTEKASFSDHVSGESGSAARKNSFDNNDSNRVIHVDEDGKVTHSELMDSRFDRGRKKVKEAGVEAGASAHHSDHEEIHGNDETVKGKRGTQTHHDWDKAGREGQHGEAGQNEIKDYKAAEAAMKDAQDSGDSEEEANQQKIMEDMDKESGGALGMMSDTEKEQQRIDRGQPPGPPPRPGLVWAASIHHWVNPDKLSDMQSGLGDGEGMHIAPGDFQTMLGHGDSDPSAPHKNGAGQDTSIGHQGAIHVTQSGVHRVTDIPDPNEGTPTNLAQNLGASAKHGSAADLASHSLSTALADAGLMGGEHVTDEEGKTTWKTNHGKSGKVKEGTLGKTGEDLHGRAGHAGGERVHRPQVNPYVQEVKEIHDKERNEKRKAQLKTAIGRFRAIRDNPLKEAKAAGKAAGEAVGREAKRKARGTARGGMRAFRAIHEELQGEFTGSPIEDLKIMGRKAKEGAKEIAEVMPLVGPEAGARKRVDELVRHAKQGRRQQRSQRDAAATARSERAKSQLKDIKKPTEE